MKKTAKKLGALLLVLITMIVISMVRYGFFAKIEIVDETVPSMKALVINHTGPYQNVGPLMGELYEDAKAAEIEGKIGLGIYYDNPEEVAADSLRALVGQVLLEADIEKLDTLLNKYRLVSIPEFEAKVVHFPYNGQLSILFAIVKVYPALKKELGDDFASATMEMYDIPGKELRFIVPQTLSAEVPLQWLQDQNLPEESESDSSEVDSLNDSVGVDSL